MFVDILSFCSLSVLFCLFLHPPSFIFYVFLFLSFVLSLITCTIFIGDTITTIPCLFNYKCLMFKSTLIVVWQPSGYMVRAFHWQYGDILLAIYFFVFTYYFVLSLKNKYTILYYTILYLMSPGFSLDSMYCSVMYLSLVLPPHIDCYIWYIPCGATTVAYGDQHSSVSTVVILIGLLVHGLLWSPYIYFSLWWLMYRMKECKFVIFGLFVALSTLIHLCNSQHGQTQLGGLRLTREYLLALNTPAALDPEYIASFDCRLVWRETKIDRSVSEDGKAKWNRDCAEWSTSPPNLKRILESFFLQVYLFLFIFHPINLLFICDHPRTIYGKTKKGNGDESQRRELYRLNVEAPDLGFFLLRDRALQWLGGSTRQKTDATQQEIHVGTDLKALVDKQGETIKKLQAELRDIKLSTSSVPVSSTPSRLCWTCSSPQHFQRNCPHFTG